MLAIDVGTTGTRAAWVDENGTPHGAAYERLHIEYLGSGIVQQDANQILTRTIGVTRAAIADATSAGAHLLSLAITTQRFSAVLWDTTTGRAVAPAMVWQDTRHASDLDRLSRGWIRRAISENGRPPGHSSAHYWAARQISQSAELGRLHEAGRLAFGTIDTWILWSLSADRRLFTSPTQASSTDAYMIASNTYRAAWIAELGFAPDLLPTIGLDVDDFGMTSERLLGASIPIVVLIGDQQAAAIALRNFRTGDASCVHGTGSFIDVNTGSVVATYNPKVPSAVPFVGCLTEQSRSYLAETNVPSTGATLNWVCASLGLFESTQEISALANTVRKDPGIQVVPALMGLHAPIVEPGIQMSITGLSGGATRAELAYGMLAGIAHSITDAIDSLHAMSHVSLGCVTVGGGLAAIDQLIQLQADLTGVPHLRASGEGLTSLRGAAYLAGVKCGLWDSLAEAVNSEKYREFLPQISTDRRQSLRAQWSSRLESEISYVRR